MMWSDLARALLLGSVPLAAVLGHVTLWQLYAVAAGAGTLGVFFDVYQVMCRFCSTAGDSSTRTASSTRPAPSPGSSGLRSAACWWAGRRRRRRSPRMPASFAVSARSLLLIRTPEPPPGAVRSTVTFRAAMGEGLSFVLRAGTRCCASRGVHRNGELLQLGNGRRRDRLPGAASCTSRRASSARSSRSPRSAASSAGSRPARAGGGSHRPDHLGLRARAHAAVPAECRAGPAGLGGAAVRGRRVRALTSSQWSTTRRRSRYRQRICPPELLGRMSVWCAGSWGHHAARLAVRRRARAAGSECARRSRVCAAGGRCWPACGCCSPRCARCATCRPASRQAGTRASETLDLAEVDLDRVGQPEHEGALALCPFWTWLLIGSSWYVYRTGLVSSFSTSQKCSISVGVERGLAAIGAPFRETTSTARTTSPRGRWSAPGRAPRPRGRRQGRAGPLVPVSATVISRRRRTVLDRAVHAELEVKSTSEWNAAGGRQGQGSRRSVPCAEGDRGAGRGRPR